MSNRYNRGQIPAFGPPLVPFLKRDLASIQRAIANIDEGELDLSDNTTADATAARHGLLPKLSGSSSDALRGDGTWGAVGGGGGAPSLGTFPSISDLVMRISAELSTMTVEPGGLVQQVNDLSGNGNHMAATAATNRPGLSSTRFGGLRPALHFDGIANQLASVGTVTIPQPCTVVCVQEGWKVGSGNGQLWMDSGGNPEVFMDGSSTQWDLYAGGSVYASTNLLKLQRQGAPPGGVWGRPVVQVAVLNGASSLLALNYTEETPGSSIGTNGFSHTVFLGGKASSFAMASVYEFCIFGHALDATERGQIVDYYMNALNIQT